MSTHAKTCMSGVHGLCRLWHGVTVVSTLPEKRRQCARSRAQTIETLEDRIRSQLPHGIRGRESQVLHTSVLGMRCSFEGHGKLCRLRHGGDSGEHITQEREGGARGLGRRPLPYLQGRGSDVGAHHSFKHRTPAAPILQVQHLHGIKDNAQFLVLDAHFQYFRTISFQQRQSTDRLPIQ